MIFNRNELDFTRKDLKFNKELKFNTNELNFNKKKESIFNRKDLTSKFLNHHTYCDEKKSKKKKRYN